jgi:hypothetical protein
VCKPPTKSKIKIRSPQKTLTNVEIPKNAPIWTLSREALQQLKWENRAIPIYDPTDQEDNNDDNNEGGNEVGTSSRKRKRKGKEKERKSKKSKKNKKNKKNKKK